jgi:hypothetical protein
MNSVVRMGHNSGFPHHFAICRSIRPVEFQLLTIVPDIHHIYEQEHYVIENDILDNLEPMYLDQQHLNGDTSAGDFYISNPTHVGDRGRRVRYEIQPMFLRNRQYVIPIILLDSYLGIPRPDMLVIPYNTERQADRQNEDPYMIINYLRNPNNFSNPRNVDFHRSRMTFHSEYDEQMHRFIEAPILWPRDYENYYRHDRNDVAFHRRAETPPRNHIRTRRNSYRAAGAVEIREIPRPAPAPQAAEPRPIVLQAFTIQALIGHAIKENMTCPISMNPIEQRTACVTSCQHVFERSSIERWFQDNSRCPVCRQEASVCV